MRASVVRIRRKNFIQFIHGIGHITRCFEYQGEIAPRIRRIRPDSQCHFISTQGLAEILRTAARTAAEALEIEGLARVDFLLDGKTGDWVLNEINTLPGFTDISMYPELWRLAGLPGKKLLTRLIELALERHGRRKYGA